MTKHIVVTRHSSDVSWLDQCRGFEKTFLYDKGPAPLPGSSVLPNVGLSTHTHLHHIVAHYENLPDVLVLCQDDPFDHSPNFLDIINHETLAGMWAENRKACPHSEAHADGYVGLGDYRLISQNLIYVDAAVKDDAEKMAFQLHKYEVIAAIWKHLFPERELPSVFPSTWGCQMVLTRERIRVNAKHVYQYLLDLHFSDPILPYAIENLFWFVFRCDVIRSLEKFKGDELQPDESSRRPS